MTFNLLISSEQYLATDNAIQMLVSITTFKRYNAVSTFIHIPGVFLSTDLIFEQRIE